MTIADLIETLQDLAAEHGDDTPLAFATQPSWPLAHDAASISEIDGTLWIALEQNDEEPYAPSAAFEGNARTLDYVA